MTRGLSDGYYEYPLETSIRPGKVERVDADFTVQLQQLSHVHELALVFRREDEYCRRSYLEMRT